MHTAEEIGIDDFQANRGPDRRYRTTPLKGLWSHTKGGFYHDGRFATLEDVINHYDNHFGLNLSASEVYDLKEYLKSLGDGEASSNHDFSKAEHVEVPEEIVIDQNYPNPFNPETTIQYQLNKAGPVKLEIYSVTGQRVRTLVNENLEAGNHQIRWDGRNDAGVQVSSGTYFYRLDAGGTAETKKMILMK